MTNEHRSIGTFRFEFYHDPSESILNANSILINESFNRTKTSSLDSPYCQHPDSRIHLWPGSPNTGSCYYDTFYPFSFGDTQWIMDVERSCRQKMVDLTSFAK